MKTTGELEIDADRGVIYFHSFDLGVMLRICGLKKIPQDVQFIDITHMIGMQIVVKDA